WSVKLSMCRCSAISRAISGANSRPSAGVTKSPRMPPSMASPLCRARKACARKFTGWSTVEHREPDCRLRGIGPADAVPAVCRDVQVIADTQLGLAAVIEGDASAAAQHQHPLVFVLVVPAFVG